MRFTALALALMPLPLVAETYTLPSAPSAVTVYSDFAMVTRTVSVDVSAGRHEIVLPDMPVWVDADALRVAVSGAVLGTTRLRFDALPPQPDRDSPAVAAARDRVEEAERALVVLEDRVADARLAATAAEARVTFLTSLGSSQTLPSDPDALAAVSRMIEAQTLDAVRNRNEAEREARRIAEERPALEEALEDARAALAALMPRTGEGALLTLSVSADTAGPVAATVSYPAAAYWQPTYDLRLTRGDRDRLTLGRAAIVTQTSGEAWDNVTLTLSTLSPGGQIMPSELYPPLLSYGDPLPPRPLERSMAGAPAPESMMIADEAAAVARFDGPGVSYAPQDPVSIASGAEGARVPLDTLEFDARVFARAVPERDETAFLMAEAVNTTEEPLLRADTAQVFVDGTLVGRTHFPPVPAGESFAQAFGPVEALRLTRTVLDRSEGDTGIINRNSARVEAVRTKIENLGDEAWEIELRAAVPYSEQDDLRIDWSATPAPDVTRAEDRRGLLQWNLSLDAGATREITLEQTVRWPEGKVLR
ncbi:DUF4139 domain-containing protein [Sulfitobacter sp. HNIBRBA3233]|uniref:DUF4139 domain-containing protein n=1 Tax=Sulfitobacter marinivivus TaxID=3158558 RepID=UPI0032DFEDC0